MGGKDGPNSKGGDGRRRRRKERAKEGISVRKYLVLRYTYTPLVLTA